MKQLIYNNQKTLCLKKIFDEYLRYILIGVLITCFDFLMLIFQVEILHIYYLTAVSVSYIIANIIHFIACEKFVFITNRRNLSSLKSFFIFFILGIFGLIILEICMFFFTECFHIYYLFAKVIATAFTFTFNFLSRKFILFNR